MTRSPIFSSFIGRYPCYERVLLFDVHPFHFPCIPLGSVTNWTLQQIVKEKNPTYEDMQLLKMTKNANKKEKKSKAKTTTALPMSTNKTLRKRSRSRKSMLGAQDDDDDDDESNNDEVVIRRKKINRPKQKGSDEPMSQKFRRTAASSEKRATRKLVGVKGKSSAGSLDGCTTVDEEQEETRLIEQSKLCVEGPGLPHSLISSFPISMKVFDRITRRSTNTMKKLVKNCRIFTMIIKQRRRRQHYHRLFSPSLPLSLLVSRINTSGQSVLVSNPDLVLSRAEP